MPTSEGVFFPEKRVNVVPVRTSSHQRRGNYTVKVGGRSIPANRSWARGVKRPYKFPANENNPSVLKAGLDEMVKNIYYGRKLEELPNQYAPRGEWRTKYDIVSKDEMVTRQFLYEVLDGVPEGHYSAVRAMPMMNSKTLNAEQIKTAKPTFVESFSIYLHEGTNAFTNTTTRGRFGILVIENHPEIAPSRDEINVNVHKFYVASQEEVLDERRKRDDVYMDAVANLKYLLDEFDPMISYQFAIALVAIKGNVSNKLASQSLRDFIMEEKRLNGKDQADRIMQFNILFQKFKANQGSLYAEYLFRQAIVMGVFRIANTDYIWNSQRGRENWYNLGNSGERIKENIARSYSEFDPQLEEDNLYFVLESELRSLSVPLNPTTAINEN